MHLRFASDIVLLTKSTNGAGEMAQEQNTECKTVEIKFNASKNQVQSNRKAQPQICLKGEVVEKVGNFRYLGQTISIEQ